MCYIEIARNPTYSVSNAHLLRYYMNMVMNVNGWIMYGKITFKGNQYQSVCESVRRDYNRKVKLQIYIFSEKGRIFI